MSFIAKRFPRVLVWTAAALLLSAGLRARAHAAALTSAQTGPWSETATWSSAAVPTETDTVTIAAGHAVTVDITTATASTTSVQGTLLFSRVVNSSLTIAGGDLAVQPGGTLDIGTEASPIPSGVWAHLVLASGSYAGEFGLIVENGGNFTVRGTTRSPFGFSDTNALASGLSVSVAASSATGWSVGDILVIGQTYDGFPGSVLSESREIQSIVASDPRVISWDAAAGLNFSHYSTGPLIVSNLTRNVLVRSSGGVAGPGGDSSYIRSLVENSTSFSLVYGEFAYLGADLPGRHGVTLDGSGTKAEISSCSFRSNYAGIVSSGALANTFSLNVFHSNEWGVRLDGGGYSFVTESAGTSNMAAVYVTAASSHNHVGGSSLAGNIYGVAVVTGTRNSISTNTAYANQYAGVYVSSGSFNTLVGNKAYHNGYAGLALMSSDDNTLQSNEPRHNGGIGVALEGASRRNYLVSNSVHTNDGPGISVGGSYNIVELNTSFSNGVHGVQLLGSFNTLRSNNFYLNGSGSGDVHGITVVGAKNIVAGNNSYINGANLGEPDMGSGVWLEGADNTLVRNFLYSNPVGIYVASSAITNNNTAVSEQLGYNASGVSLSNTASQVYFRPGSGDQNLVMKDARVNTQVGMFVTGFDDPAKNLLSYTQNYATGTLRIHGDYVLNSGGLTLDRASRLYGASATTPKIMRGGSLASVTVDAVYDAAAVSQLVTVQFDAADSQWHVSGLTDGELGTLPAGGGTADFPSGSPQFRLTLSATGEKNGDRADFALIAASPDAGFRKRLLFGDSASGFRGGRSKLTIGPGASFVLRGIEGEPAVMDRLDASSTYYTFVDSGAFTAEYSSMTNMDSGGLHLSGSGGVEISTSNFDYLGVRGGLNAYITARDLISQATFYSVGFGASRSTVGASAALNVRVDGSAAGLEWYFKGRFGGMWGEGYEADSTNAVWWWDRPPDGPNALEVGLTSMTISWAQVYADGYVLEASTAADFSGTIVSSSTYGIHPTTLSAVSLDPNTTYYLRAGALWFSATEYVNVSPAVVPTLADPVSAVQIAEVYHTSVTMNWAPLPTAAQQGSSRSCEGYGLEASTAADFTGTVFSSITPSVGLSTLTVDGLFGDTTYYFRVASLNWGSEPNYVAAPSTATRSACADLLSVRTGAWADRDTWSRGFLPSACNAVTVRGGHTVTVDIATAVASTTAVQGTLYFSRVADGSLTIVGGDLTIEPGGTLDLGTEASPIPSGVRTELVLALGGSAGEYGLIIEDGASFFMRGETKSPYGTAVSGAPPGATNVSVPAWRAAGWAVGDEILIGPTQSGAPAAEKRTITSLSGVDPRTVSWSGGLSDTHYSSGPLIIGNLTKNVTVRSSGTQTSANTAYVRNRTTQSSDFIAAHGEFAYLGAAAASRYGVTFDGAGVGGSVSSCTIRDGEHGLYLNQASSNTFRMNLVHNNAYGLTFSASSKNHVDRNAVLESSQYGLGLLTGSARNTVEDNYVYRNGEGIRLAASSGENSLAANRVFANGGDGIVVSASHLNVLASNVSHSNAGDGLMLLAASSNTLAFNSFFGNGGYALLLDDALTGNLFANGFLGYDASGSTATDGSGEIYFEPGSAQGLTLRETRLNLDGGVPAAGFDTEGTFMVSYHQNLATGTIRLRGDYTVSGETWTIRHSYRIYGSTATRPRTMRGGSVLACSVNSTADGFAVGQRVKIEYRTSDSLWHVVGSSSGELGTLPAAGGTADFPGTFTQFNLTLSASGAQDGDMAEFVVFAAPDDAGIPKKLLFESAAPGFRGGRSRLSIAPDAGFEINGIGGQHVLVDRLDAASTYYTFVDSGSFTSRFGTFFNMDADGIQLSGGGGVIISSTTFDLVGISKGTNAYITARDLDSEAILPGVLFDGNRLQTGTTVHNVLVTGADGGLFWVFDSFSGVVGGEDFDSDPNDRVYWDTYPVPVLVGTTQGVSSITWSWADVPEEDNYRVLSSTDANLSGDLNENSVSWVETDLSTNTAYTRRVAAVYAAGPSTSSPVTRYTHAMPPTTPFFLSVFATSAAFTWSSNTNPAGTLFESVGSTATDFSGSTVTSSVLTNTTQLTGMTANTTWYVRTRALNGDGVGTEYAAVISTVLAPAVPTTLSSVLVTSYSVSIDWSPNGNNEPGTDYDLWRALDLSFANPVRVTVSSSAYDSGPGLPPDTTYFFRVRAESILGGYSVFSNTFSVRTLPSLLDSPKNLRGSAMDASSILWNWDQVSGADGYRIYVATETATELGNSASLGYILTDLSTNTAYSVAAAAENVTGVGKLSAGATAYTLAAEPVGLTAATVHITSAAVEWALGTNPEGTLARLERSADGTSYSEVLAAAATTFIDGALSACTTYYFRVRNENGDGALTGYHGPYSFITMGSTPLAPGGLVAESLAGRRISLTWDASPSQRTAYYRLYYDAGTGTVDYSSPYAVFTATVTGWTTPALGAGTQYRFGLRAVNECGVEEDNVRVSASATALDSLAGVRAAIRSPTGGLRITGDRVTVMAERVLGEAADVKHVLFQYKAATATVWSDVPSASLPNPDTEAPYLIHCDLTDALTFAATSYDLRAVAVDLFDAADAGPPVITVTVDPATPDVTESQSGGEIRKERMIHNTVATTVRLGDASKGHVPKIVIPAGALDDSTTTVRFVSDPSGAPPAPAGVLDMEMSAEVRIMSSGQTALSGGKLASLTFTYVDDNGDGIVDGTSVRADDMEVRSAETAAGPWRGDVATSVDRDARTITGYTSHFSFFAVFAPTFSDLSGARLYPNPFKPNSGSSDDGVPYRAGDLNSGIIFDNLPAGAAIRVFTLNGELAASFEVPAGGRVQWDARNDRGNYLASGVYFAVISLSGDTQVKKFVIIR